MTTLTFLNGPRQGETLSLSEGTWSVGRAPDNAVVIQDASVSARHAELLISFGEVIVHDLGASNGTFVEGRKIKSQYPVNPGQKVRLGAIEVQVQFETDAEEDATQVTASYSLHRPEPTPPISLRANVPQSAVPLEHTQISSNTAGTGSQPSPTSQPVTALSSKQKIFSITIGILLAVVVIRVIEWLVSR